MGSGVWVIKMIISTETVTYATGSFIGVFSMRNSMKATEYSLLGDP